MEKEGSQFCPIKQGLKKAVVEIVSRWLCLVAGALQQPGVFGRSGFYYLPDVGLMATLLEHQVSR